MGFDVFKTVVQVQQRGGRRESGIPGGHGSGDLGVFAGRGTQSRRGIMGESAQPGQMHAQALEGLGQIGIGCGVLDGGIQLASQGIIAIALGGGTERAGRGVEASGQFVEDGRAAGPGCAACGFDLQGPAERKQVIDMVQGDIGDHDPATSLGYGQTIRCQP